MWMERVKEQFAKWAMGIAFLLALLLVGAIIYGKVLSSHATALEKKAEQLSKLAKKEAERGAEMEKKADELGEKADTLALRVSELEFQRQQKINAIAAAGSVAIRNPEDLVPLPVDTSPMIYGLVQTQALEIDTLKQEGTTLRLQVSTLTDSRDHFKRAYELESQAHDNTKLALAKERKSSSFLRLGNIAIGFGVGYVGGRLQGR